jgi:organic anion transporter 5A
LVGWLVSWLVGWLDSWLVGWLVGWIVGWLPVWLAGWTVDWLRLLTSNIQGYIYIFVKYNCGWKNKTLKSELCVN